jgi:hypothetical protein
MYHADVLMGRSEKVKKETFLESFEVDVAVFDTTDMPIALSVEINHDKPTQFRYRAGTFFTEDERDGGIDAKSLTPGNEQGAKLSEWIMHSVDLPVQSMKEELKAWYFSAGYDDDRRPHPSQVREWLISNRETALEKARNYASKLAILDGKVWFPVEEPKLGVSNAVIPAVSICGRPISYAAQKSSTWGHPVNAPVFNMNAIEDVDAHCARFDRLHVAFNRHSLDIRMPEVFTFDRAAHTIDWAANEVIDYVASSIKHSSDDAVLKWLDARRVFSEGDHTGEEWEEAVAQAVEELLPYISSKVKRQSIEEMLTLWADSTISLNVRDQNALIRS